MVTNEDLYNKLNELEKLILSQKKAVESKDLLDVVDVCKLLNISKRTLHNYVSKKLLKPKRILGKLYFERSIIERAMN